MRSETKVEVLFFIVMVFSLVCLKLSIDEFNRETEVYKTEIVQQEDKIEQLKNQKQAIKELVISAGNENQKLSQAITEIQGQLKELKIEKENLANRSSLQRTKNLGEFSVTSYDLSVASCGKPIGHKEYGITASGYNLTGHTWKSARAIAVDPKVIPLGSKVRVTFLDESYSKYNSEYIAVDTGRAVKGKIIDLFLGDFNTNEESRVVRDFGRTKAIVEIIKNDKE